MSEGVSLPNRPLVRASDLAKALGLSHGFILSELRSGEIANTFQIGAGRHWRIPAEAARAYVTRLTGRDFQ